MSERVLICGSRTWTDRAAIERVMLDELTPDSIIIHGAARGADRLADDVAVTWGMPRIACPADWARHGKFAGPIRNRQMLARHQPDRVIAFRMPGTSPGTDDMVRLARRAGIPVLVIGSDDGREAG